MNPKLKNLLFIISMSVLLFNLVTINRTIYIEGVGERNLVGFPFGYSVDGWHTSMSTYYFIKPLIIDYLAYLAASIFIFRIIQLFKVRRSKWVYTSLLVIAIVQLLYSLLWFNMGVNTYKYENPYEYKLLKTNVEFL